MEEEQDPSAEYIKRFNQAYTMQQYEPDFLKNILSVTDEKSESIQAMKAGKAQFELEEFKKEIELAKIKQKHLDQDRSL